MLLSKISTSATNPPQKAQQHEIKCIRFHLSTEIGNRMRCEASKHSSTCVKGMFACLLELRFALSHPLRFTASKFSLNLKSSICSCVRVLFFSLLFIVIGFDERQFWFHATHRSFCEISALGSIIQLPLTWH